MELELKPINVLIGSNGSGKSNFLSFFKLLHHIFNQQLQLFVNKEGTDNLLYFGRKTTAHLEGRVIFSEGKYDNNAYIFTLIPTNEGGLFIKKEGSGHNVLKDDDSWNYFYDNALKESEIISSNWKRDIYLSDHLSNIQPYHFHDTSNASWLRKDSPVEDNRLLKSDGRNLAAFLFKLKQKHPANYRRILRTVQSVAPFIHDFILVPSETKGRERSIELRWIDKSDLDSNFSVYHFSDGTLRFIALTTALLQPEPQSVMIIDEPELGLHPLAIAKIAGMIQIASKKAQVIVATQSVTLVDCFSPEQIITTDRDAGQSIFKRLNADDFKIWLETHSLGELWERNIINAAQPFTK